MSSMMPLYESPSREQEKPRNSDFVADSDPRSRRNLDFRGDSSRPLEV